MTFHFVTDERAMTPPEKVLSSLQKQVDLTSEETLQVKREIEESFDRGYGFSFDIHTRSITPNEACPKDAVFVFHQQVMRQQLFITQPTKAT